MRILPFPCILMRITGIMAKNLREQQSALKEIRYFTPILSTEDSAGPDADSDAVDPG